MLFVGCGGYGTGNTTVATRIIDAVPSAVPIDVSVSGAGFVSNLSFRDVTTYGFINQGDNDFVAFANGTNNVVAPNQKLTINESASTVLVAGIPGDSITPPMFFSFSDDNTVPRSGTIRVRVLNGAPDAGPIDVSVGSTVVASGIAYGAASPYLQIPAGTFNVSVVKAGTSSPVASKGGLLLASGHVFTLVAVGRLADGSATIVAQADV